MPQEPLGSRRRSARSRLERPPIWLSSMLPTSITGSTTPAPTPASCLSPAACLVGLEIPPTSPPDISPPTTTAGDPRVGHLLGSGLAQHDEPAAVLLGFP